MASSGGDELPPELRVSGDRRKRLAAARRMLDDEREAESSPVPHERTSRLKQGERRLREEWELDHRVNAEYERWRARGISVDGRRFGGRDPYPYHQPESPQGIANSTDPDSRKVKLRAGTCRAITCRQ